MTFLLSKIVPSPIAVAKSHVGDKSENVLVKICILNIWVGLRCSVVQSSEPLFY